MTKTERMFYEELPLCQKQNALRIGLSTSNWWETTLFQ